MQDSITPALKRDDNRPGFTIVELLIVIVVIGILAAITIVAYNGIQGRAIAASLQSDLENASKKLKLFQVDNNAYPTTNDCSATPAAGSICLKSASGTTYTTINVNNSTYPQTFCLTATNGSTNYYINQDGAPMSGGCAVTNLVVNPSLETDATSWSYRWYGGGAGAGTNARGTNGGFSGNAYLRKTWTTSGTGQDNGFNTYTIAVVPGIVYTASGYMRTNRSDVTVRVGYQWRDSSGTVITSQFTGTQVTLIPNTWSRIKMTTATPSNAASVDLIFSNLSSPAAWIVGDTFDVDAAMLTTGPTTYNYADGNSTNWIWSGSINTSTSTGPPL